MRPSAVVPREFVRTLTFVPASSSLSTLFPSSLLLLFFFLLFLPSSPAVRRGGGRSRVFGPAAATTARPYSSFFEFYRGSLVSRPSPPVVALFLDASIFIERFLRVRLLDNVILVFGEKTAIALLRHYHCSLSVYCLFFVGLVCIELAQF